jgi:hypothetical protein
LRRSYTTMPLRFDEPDPPLEHADYDLLEGTPVDPACFCFLCKNYRVAAADVRALEGAPEVQGHNHADCRCKACKGIRDARIVALSCDMQRTVYSELSYLTAGRAWQPDMLAWVVAYFKTSRKKHSFFAFRLDRQTLGKWVENWAKETGRIN